MRVLRFVLAIVLISGFFSCQKEKSFENSQGVITGNQWEFKDSTLLFNGIMEAAFFNPIVNPAITILTLEGKTDDGQGELFIQLLSTNNIVKGTYSNPSVIFNYSISGATYYENIQADVNRFSVNITNIDADFVEGTFSGEVMDALGNMRMLREGKFKAPMQATPPSNMGQLMIWSKNNCSGGSIRVKVESQEGMITTFHSTEPVCGTAGTASFVLPQGQYTWEAICGTDTIRGTSGVTANSCIRAEVIFGPVVPGTNCRIIEYTAFDPVTSDFFQSIKSTFNGSQVSKVEVFDTSPTTAASVFNVTYAPGRINIDAQQYFELDPSNRVITYRGFLIPDDAAQPRVIVTYTYNTQGQLTKSSFAGEQNPNVAVLESTHTWTNGNVTKIVLQQIGTAAKTEIEYEYDLTKQPKNFLIFFPNSELLYFQSAVNTGVNSVNAVIKSTVKEYNDAGNLESSEVALFSNYVINNENYVTAFNISDATTVYGGNVRYTVGYKCF